MGDRGGGGGVGRQSSYLYLAQHTHTHTHSHALHRRLRKSPAAPQPPQTLICTCPGGKWSSDEKSPLFVKDNSRAWNFRMSAPACPRLEERADRGEEVARGGLRGRCALSRSVLTAGRAWASCFYCCCCYLLPTCCQSKQEPAVRTTEVNKQIVIRCFHRGEVRPVAFGECVQMWDKNAPFKIWDSCYVLKWAKLSRFTASCRDLFYVVRLLMPPTIFS